MLKRPALAELDGQTARAKADALSIPKSYGDYKEMLKDPEIQTVHICAPNSFHYKMAKDALLAGKHVLCEKPLTMKSGEAAELVSLAQQKNLLGVVHFNVRFYRLSMKRRL